MKSSQLVALVDDDEAFRDAMRDLLDSAGIESLPFESAEAFLRHDLRDAVTCVLLDIKLPGMNGLELQHLLDQWGSRTPVLFLTSVDDPQLHQRAMLSGAKGFFTKPADSSQLLDRIQKLATMAAE